MEVSPVGGDSDDDTPFGSNNKGGEIEARLPSDTMAERRLVFDLRKDDPSNFYDIIERIGVGGFAKVFKV